MASAARGVALLVVLALLLSGCDGKDVPERGSAGSSDDGAVTQAVTAFFDDATGYNEGVQALLVHVAGDPVVERYRGTRAEARRPLMSLTTAVVSLLVGVAVAQGAIDGLDERLADLLPDRVDAMSAGVRAVTLRQLLTMTGGFRDDSRAWEGATRGVRDDWVGSALRSQQGAVGQFHTSGAGFHLLSAVLQEATGRSLQSYADEVLFGPLGISGAEWPADPQGVTLGSSGLRLTAADQARIGQMMADGGRWDGEPVVPSDWVHEATRTQVRFQQLVEPSGEYGYGWWVLEAGGHAAFAAADISGQVLEVVPAERLVVVFSSRMHPMSHVGYWGPLSWVSQLIVPALEQRSGT